MASKSFDNIKIVESAPEKSYAHLAMSRRLNRKVRIFPEHDKLPLTINQRLVTEYYSLNLADEELKKINLIHYHMRKKRNEQWMSLFKKQIRFGQCILKYNKFVKNNIEKKERVKQRIYYEQQLHQIKNEIAKDLNLKILKFANLSEKLKQSIEKYHIYEDYLQEVVKLIGCNSIQDIIYKYEILISTRKCLMKGQEKYTVALEEAQREMLNMLLARDSRLTSLLMQVDRLNTKHQIWKYSIFHWKKILHNIKLYISNIELESDQVKTCCQTLYQQICQRKQMPQNLKWDDFIGQLICIRNTIQELKAIETISRKNQVKHNRNFFN